MCLYVGRIFQSIRDIINVDGNEIYFNPFSAGIDFRRQILNQNVTSKVDLKNAESDV